MRWTPRLLAAFEEGDSAGVPSSPILITPVRQKKYESYKSTIQSLWCQAVEALEGVNRVVIAGFSFPPTDTRALDLIRSLLSLRGSEIELEIINPGARQVATRIGEDCLTKVKGVKLRDMKMEEYAELLSDSMPALMRKAAAEHREVREWLERIYVMSVRSGYPGVIA